MSEGVINRRMTFCDRLLSTYATHELYETCDHCDQFFCICCLHSSGNKSCHHYPVVFTDGACSGNGFGGAVSGIGGSYGENAEHRWSILVDDCIDPNAVRTNQRAELLAAIEGVRRLGDLLLSSSSNEPARKGPRTEMVVATDSEYVCKGVTEWMPKWKTNGWRNSSRKIVSNKDLFCDLDEAISALEACHIDVGFWWIGRQLNWRADALAKAACSVGQC